VSENPLFSFIHCADLHLDSPFEGIHAVEPDIATILRDATFKAFDNVIDHAVRECADFLIIAGDVYDGADRSLRAQLRFREELRRAVENNIQCFLIHGNHDPLSGWEAGLTMPEGVYRFGGEKVNRIVAKRGSEELAHIYGFSYPVREVRENLVSRFQREGGAPFAIGVLHCNVGGDPNHDNYAPCALDDLGTRGMDYWALGHIHAKKVLSQHGPCIVYSGNTQGRSLKELGPRGCYHVCVDETGLIRAQFLATDVVRWFAEEVNITGLNSIDELVDRLYRVREDVRSYAEGRGAILRMQLVGRGDLHTKLRRVEPDRDLTLPLREGEIDRSDFVWVDSVIVTTRPTIDIPQRSLVEDFIGDFLRAAQTVRNHPNPGGTIRELFMSRPEHRVILEQIAQLSEPDLLSTIDEAEVLGLNQLLGEEE